MLTKELTGTQLDWAVAKAAGLLDLEVKVGESTAMSVVLAEQRQRDSSTVWYCFSMSLGERYSPSTRPEQAAVYIDGEFKINVNYVAGSRTRKPGWYGSGFLNKCEARGDTPMEAAMRSYVLHKLGAGVKLPKELE